MHRYSINLFQDWVRDGYRLLVRRRTPGEPAEYLKADGSWEPVSEKARDQPEAGEYGISLPEGVLEEVVRQFLQIQPPNQATERHLRDAIGMRDRLLTLVERS